MMISSRRLRCLKHVARIEEMGNVCNLFVGKPERKKLLGKSNRRWEDNIKTDLREIR
jgi:hypothetical protein